MKVKLYITCSTVKSQHRKVKVYHMFSYGIPTQEIQNQRNSAATYNDKDTHDYGLT